MPVGIVRQAYDIDTTTLDRFGVIATISNVSPHTRGILPGYTHSLLPGFQGFAFPIIRNINGDDHLLITNYQSGPSNTWLNTEVWNDPFGYV